MNKDGFIKKYNITKTDGSSVDPKGTFIVLRLDTKENPDNDSRIFSAASRDAILEFCNNAEGQFPNLCEDLRRIVKENSSDDWRDITLRQMYNDVVGQYENVSLAGDLVRDDNIKLRARIAELENPQEQT